jgi:hypothetical protein
MKLKSFVVACAFALMSVPALAQWFPANARMTVLPFEVRAEVVNFWGWPVRCQGQVFGRTFYGFTRTAWFDQFIPAGQWRFASVYAWPGDNFVWGHSQINCFRAW